MLANPGSLNEPSLDQSPAPGLHGQRVAFVGQLGSVTKREASDIVRRHGGQVADQLEPSVTLVVVGADVVPDEDPEELMQGWVAQAVAQQSLTVINETRFWQQLGLLEQPESLPRLYTPAMLAGLLQVPLATIRRWHRRRLIRPTRQVKKLPYFDFQEVATARRIASMIAGAARPEAIEDQLTWLFDQYPHVQRPLSELSLVADGGSLLVREQAGLFEPGGQQRIDFAALEEDSDLQRAETLRLPLADSLEEQLRWDPQQLQQWAEELEDRGELAESLDVYRLLSMTRGPRALDCFRMAELMYQMQDLAGARERYLVALELDEGLVEARANLGCVLVELEQRELALAVFRGALQHHPDYADVHFHLARLLDDLGRVEEAAEHWRSFIRLSPASPWTEEARDRLAATASPATDPA